MSNHFSLPDRSCRLPQEMAVTIVAAAQNLSTRNENWHCIVRRDQQPLNAGSGTQIYTSRGQGLDIRAPRIFQSALAVCCVRVTSPHWQVLCHIYILYYGH
jgi:hypothetical protein